MEVTTWVENLIASFETNEAETIENMLWLEGSLDIINLSRLEDYPSFSSNISQIVMNQRGRNPDNGKWEEWVKAHILFLAAGKRKEQLKRFEYLNLSLGHFVGIYKSSLEGKWSANIVKSICLKLYYTALEADKLCAQLALKQENLKEGVRTIQSMFAACQMTQKPFPDSRIYAGLYCINVLLRIFFKLDKVQQSKNFFSWVDQTGIILSHYPKADQVTYRYYAGRMALNTQNYILSEEQLLFAYSHCHIKARKNMILILRYLIPVRLFLGATPSVLFLNKYALKEYEGITKAIITGNIKLFNQQFELYEELFINKGVYLIVDKLKTVIYRNLFRKVYKIVNKNQIKIDAFHNALVLLGEDVDLDETECLLANLIYKGWIKGYISHENNLIALSKLNPFPNIRQVFKTHAEVQ